MIAIGNNQKLMDFNVTCGTGNATSSFQVK
jgi:hypothetical protein